MANLFDLLRHLVAWWISYVRAHLAVGLALLLVLALALAVADIIVHRNRERTP